MTEDEVLKKLEVFKNVILKLKEEKDIMFEQLSSLNEEYDKLKTQTYHTIKHLVEDVIEVQEKQIEEIKKANEFAENETLLKLNKKIEELTKQNITWEEQFNKQREKLSSYELANKQLENRMASASRVEQAIDDLDEVVNDIKNDEVHKMVVKPAERELQEMIG